MHDSLTSLSFPVDARQVCQQAERVECADRVMEYPRRYSRKEQYSEVPTPMPWHCLICQCQHMRLVSRYDTARRSFFYIIFFC